VGVYVLVGLVVTRGKKTALADKNAANALYERWAGIYSVYADRKEKQVKKRGPDLCMGFGGESKGEMGKGREREEEKKGGRDIYRAACLPTEIFFFSQSIVPRLTGSGLADY
jgi:hypothetical protein